MLNHWQIYLAGLMAISLFALAGWVLSLARDNVTHVDSMWSLFLAMSAYAYALFFYELSPRTLLTLTLVTLWAIRLCGYLTWRNWYPHEDHHYAVLQQNNAPYFWLKSFYRIFGLQAVLAWLISMSLFGAIASSSPLNTWDYLGTMLVVIGCACETVADWQLATFKANPNHQGKVLNSGLWHYCRHPNYLGECGVWWGFYCIALAGGAWWTIASPLLMTFLLPKFSGVTWLKK